ncbi:DUF4186 domain-containing protein [Acetobacter sp. DsW_54]|uniref:DUF4186 domain-containing protein n=2 Tax=Acetobacter TaxID=434 RepID=UPI000A3C7854|nr:DUF4186 domain-containing protein [Acetobacter sp. DsW_54]
MTFFQDDLFPRRTVAPQAVVPPELWEKLARSTFRQRFHLNAQDMAYLREKGLPLVLEHGQDFIARRLAPAAPLKDGRQTPWKGHPVFVAQHATGTCCRSCLAKWHALPSGRQLNEAEQDYILSVLAHWLAGELARPDTPQPARKTRKPARPPAQGVEG